ncbi:hypothetical protein ABEB36_002770 [Hypothenemus hampei]|uniref:Follicle cell protein 3C-1 n=1 Tax=Hypothenemus hampei TaxID=57062 RepID=A0ABD1F8Q6_HYPHA
MHRTFFFLIICILPQAILSATVISNNTLILQSIEDKSSTDVSPPEDIPCTCGVFLSSQFKKGSKDQPKGDPVLTQEIDAPFMNNAIGNKQCTHRCLEAIIKHLPKSSDIICATVDRDTVNREKAFLFVRNHSDKWHPTSFSAGREYCCKDHVPLKCTKSSK